MTKLSRFDNWILLCIIPILLALTILVGSRNPFFWSTAGGSLLLGTWALINGGDTRREFLFLSMALSAALFAAVIGTEVVFFLTPHTIDQVLLGIDGGLSVRFWRWTMMHPPYRTVLEVVYINLPLSAAVVALTTPHRMHYARTLGLATVLAPFFYVAFPAVGPAFIHTQAAPRNCIPSLHMTWALMLVPFSARRMRWFTVPFAALTAVATIGLGEHYVLDLLAAVPFMAVTFWISDRVRLRRNQTSRLPHPVDKALLGS